MRFIITFLLTSLFINSLFGKDHPNIVMIISDDQTWRDFGFMGHHHVKTPHLDALAKNSALFENGYVPSSVCRPSLVSILTGLFPHEHGITYNHGPPGNTGYNQLESVTEYENIRRQSFLRTSVPTLPRTLQLSGYKSFQTGKFWEGPYHRAGFTHGMTLFKPVPGQDYGGNRQLKSGELVAHGNGDWGLRIGREGMQPIYDFIKETQNKNDPWFVWYAPYLPHQPHDSPQKYREPYQNQKGVKAHQIPYFASITHFDETVGNLVAHLKKNQLLDNTLIVFVVDNGWSPSAQKMRHKNGTMDFQKNHTSKRAPFDEGIRTPIFFHWPKAIEANRYQELISSIDIVPTILDICGHDAELLNLSGKTQWPVLNGTSLPDPSRAVYGEIYPGNASVLHKPYKDIAYRWIRLGDHKLIVPHFHGHEKAWQDYIRKEALYNLKNDPDEKKNLIDHADTQKVRFQLRQLLDHWWKPMD
jgi:uncharacterized sulfatase